MTAKFSGVLMPGWDDCSACAEGVTLYERPFASGTLTYKDSGATVSLPVTITASPGGE